MTARTLILCLVIACSGGGTSGSGTTTPTGPTSGSGSAAGGGGGSGTAESSGIGVHLDVDPVDALVTIDDEPRGKVSELDPVVALAPGLHTFVITLAGYKTYRAEFSVTDKVETFVVKLEKQ